MFLQEVFFYLIKSMSINPSKNDKPISLHQAPVQHTEPTSKPSGETLSSDISKLSASLSSAREMVNKLRGEALGHQAASNAADKGAEEERAKGDSSLFITQGLMKIAKFFGFNTDKGEANSSDIGQLMGERAKQTADEAMGSFSSAHGKIKEAQEEMQAYIDATDRANTYDVHADGLKNSVQSKSKGRANIDNPSNGPQYSFETGNTNGPASGSDLNT